MGQNFQVFEVRGKTLDKFFVAMLLCIGVLCLLIIFVMPNTPVAHNDLGRETAAETVASDDFFGSLTWQRERLVTLLSQIPTTWKLTILAFALLAAAAVVSAARRLVGQLHTAHQIAMTDYVTGIGNRAALAELKNSAELQKAMETGTFAVISLDLDDFKELNDDLGHLAGDEALNVTAARMKASMPDPERVFRTGGDEFVCVILGADPARVAQDVVARLYDAFRAPMDLGGVSRVVTPSIGLAVANKGEGWEEIFKRSDAAMYQSKRRELAQAV